MFLKADRIFDGRDTFPGQPVLQVAGERIVEMGQPFQKAGPEDCLDFPGCTILPGLIDTHVHLVFSAQTTNAAVITQVTSETDEQLLVRAAQNAQAALRAGITTVRDCGGRGTIIQRLRDRIRRGDLIGPTVLSCGAPITTTTGHCHWLGLVADTYEEVVQATERMLAEEVDFLKVMATGGNMTPSSDPMRAQYDDATLLTIADRGRRADKHAAAHVLSRAALPGVVAANFRTIEHCDWRVEEWRYEFDPNLARRIRDQGQIVGLTLSGNARRKLLPEVQALNDGPVKRLDARFACEQEMLAAGIRYTLHSDAGVRFTPIEAFALGLRCAALELRLTPAEVIRAATATAAEAIGLPDRGEVAVGKRADLLIVEGNPAQDLTALHRVRAVLKAGAWVPLTAQPT